MIIIAMINGINIAHDGKFCVTGFDEGIDSIECDEAVGVGDCDEAVGAGGIYCMEKKGIYSMAKTLYVASTL